ncbi:hypothetical protein UVI_02011670 [Ustilaginoidea virens]|uniref:magnesium chelatase n=1 Tax=Ustilaginoidea virens TaxID=1159556 RepID=A0A063CE57_USTVR|nr:hypothetical protein UVI_02011670 [Ustilaginoidea virens]
MASARTAAAAAAAANLPDILSKVHHLSDLQLALLLCLVSREHAIIATPSALTGTLVRELSLIATTTFGLAPSVVRCTPRTSLDDFVSALSAPREPPPPAAAARRPDYFVHDARLQSSAAAAAPRPGPGPGQVAGCVVAENLHLAPRPVQLQALELLRTRRVFTHTAVLAAPKRFLFIPVLAAEAPGRGGRLNPHLNDAFSMAHWHDPGQGFVHVEEAEEHAERASMESVVRKDAGAPPGTVSISEADVSLLARLSQQVEMDIDVVRYQMNITSFLRMHRAVRDGISPAATKHFDKLVRCLAPLHNMDYVTPALVGMAAKKIYLHRIRITTPENERSMQWGSTLAAVAALLKDVGPEQVVDDVLDMVTVPV